MARRGCLLGMAMRMASRTMLAIDGCWRRTAYDPPGVEIHHDGQVQPALLRADIGDVGYPSAIGLDDGELPLQDIRIQYM